MTRILACIDASIYATSVVDHAAWAADRLGAEIEVLHVEELAVEIAVADEGLQIQSRVSVVLSSVHDVSF